MKNLSIRLKQAVVFIMILIITMVTCLAFTGCSQKDQSGEVVQVEEEMVVEEAEPDDITP